MNSVKQIKNSVNKQKVELKVKSMYRDVALNPHNEYHFEMGKELALKLGYKANDLDRVPMAATESFAGVGYHFDMADISPGEKILDLGSGSGMDLFIAANKTGSSGHVEGIDMTVEQLDKARNLADQNGYKNVSFTKAYIEELPINTNEYDVVISNGVINLSTEKAKVFRQIAKVLKKGGRMAISDIITEKEMPSSISCNSTLWASCIGGAAQLIDYKNIIEEAGLKIKRVVYNDKYSFISKSAQGASKDYGVKSISLLAEKI